MKLAANMRIPLYIMALIGSIIFIGPITYANELILVNAIIANNPKSAQANLQQNAPEEKVLSNDTAKPDKNLSGIIFDKKTGVAKVDEQSAQDGIIFEKSSIKSGAVELSNTPVNTQKPKLYELHGNLNNKYVYLMVEKNKDKLVSGYLFDGKGNKKYIYGELINNTLQIYDPSNKKSTVLLNDKSIPSERDNAFENKSQYMSHKNFTNKYQQ